MGNPNFLRGRISNSQASCQKLGFPERKDFIKVGDRIRMDREQRAKQFMPFAALKGYEKALRQKEQLIDSEKEPSEEYCDESGEIFLEDIYTLTIENE